MKKGERRKPKIKRKATKHIFVRPDVHARLRRWAFENNMTMGEAVEALLDAAGGKVKK